MHALLLQIIGALVRMALGGVIAMLLREGIIQPDQVPQLVAGITIALISGGWIVWNKVKAARLVNTALALPPGFTLEGAQEMIKEGKRASALTPPDHLPAISFPPATGTKNQSQP